MCCTRLAHDRGNLSVCVGDSSWHSEETAKKSRIAPLNAIVIIITIMVVVSAAHVMLVTVKDSLALYCPLEEPGSDT